MQRLHTKNGANLSDVELSSIAGRTFLPLHDSFFLPDCVILGGVIESALGLVEDLVDIQKCWSLVGLPL